MKKLLSLLSVLTISGTAVPTTAAASPYQKQKKIQNYNNLKRNKRTPPSLKDLITTVNIGQIIKIINKKNILQILSEINHPIISRSDFLEHAVVENITATSATVHSSQNIIIDNTVIPSSITFNLLFSSSIRKKLNRTDFNNSLNVINNRPETIIAEFIRENPNFELEPEDLIIEMISFNTALIRSSDNNINYLFSVPVFFNTTNFTLRTFIKNTNLGTLETNSAEDIITRIRQLNDVTNHNLPIALEVRNITRNSADILFSRNINRSDNLNMIHSSMPGADNIYNFDFDDVLNVSFNIIELNTRNPNSDSTPIIGTPSPINTNAISKSTSEEIVVNPNRYFNSEKIKFSSNPDYHFRSASEEFSSNPDLYSSGNLRQTINNNGDGGRRRGPNVLLRRITDSCIDAIKLSVNTNAISKSTSEEISCIITNTDLGVIENSRPETILREVIRRNQTNLLRGGDNLNVENITLTSATITSTSGDFYGSTIVNFTIEGNQDGNNSSNQDGNDSKRRKIISQYNSISKEQKQQKLNEINQHYQNLSENDKKDFIDKLKVIGTSAIGAGISAIGTKINVSGLATQHGTAAVSTEAIEMTPLLSEGGLAIAETLSVAEGTAVVATEGAIIGSEAGAAAALAPETLGL